MAGVVTHLQRLKDVCLHTLSACLTRWTKPLTRLLAAANSGRAFAQASLNWWQKMPSYDNNSSFSGEK
jgi:hypothetical protein